MHARNIGFGFRQCLVPERCHLRGFVPRLSHQPSQTPVRGGYIVEPRDRTRRNNHILVRLICTLPDTVRLIAPNGARNFLESNIFLHALCVGLHVLNGAANTLNYMVQTWLARRIQCRMRSPPISRGRSRRSLGGRQNVSYVVEIEHVSSESCLPLECLGSHENPPKFTVDGAPE